MPAIGSREFVLRGRPEQRLAEAVRRALAERALRPRVRWLRLVSGKLEQLRRSKASSRAAPTST